MIDITHVAQLMNISIALNKTLLIRTYFDVTEKHIRAFQSLGKNIEQRQLLSMIKSKLPGTII